VKSLAELLPGQYSLRALDAFQLAAVPIWCRENPGGRLFVCCDLVLAEAAYESWF
jgi:hypothetical protein